MIAWRHRARLGFAAFTAVFGVIVYMAMGSRPPSTAAGPVERADPNAVIESTGAIVTQAKGTEEDFKIEAARQLTYADGASRLEDVRITVARRAGRTFDVTGRQADVGPGRAIIDLEGDVRIVADDGFTALTDHATFREDDGMLRIPGYVEFFRERLAGSGQGATYDRARDVLWLLDDAHVTIAPHEDGRGGMVITSRAAGVARAEGFMRFDDDVRIERAGEIIEAQTVYAYFTEAQDHIQLVELRGDSSVTGREGAPGSLEALRGTDIDLVYGDDGQTLRETTLVEDASITVRGGPETAGRGVAADRLDVGLEADGETVQWLKGNQNVVLDFEASDTTAARRISASAIEGEGEPGLGLTSLELTGGVEQRETSLEDDSILVVMADTLTLAVAPGLGDVQDADYAGDVRFERGALSGTADVATYDVSSGMLGLLMLSAIESAPKVDSEIGVAEEIPPSGETDGAGAIEALGGETDGATGTTEPPAVGAPERRPTVTDERAVIEADSIDLEASGGALTATGEVKSVMHARAPAATPGDGPMAQGRRPALLTEDAPVYVTASDLEYERSTGRAVYTGDARLWQGETTIQGDSITLDNETGDLISDGAARSVMVLHDPSVVAPAPGGAGPTADAIEPETSLATAERLVYEESGHSVTYHGAPAPVAAVPVPVAPTVSGEPVIEPWILAQVTGPQGELSARRVELYLGEDGRTLERVEAYGEVELRTEYLVAPVVTADDPTGAAVVEPVVEQRDALGDRMTYFVSDERYVMEGTPVTIIEKCRETQGNSLTFFKAVDTISVDGNAEIRTQTRAGSDCEEPPSL